MWHFAAPYILKAPIIGNVKEKTENCPDIIITNIRIIRVIRLQKVNRVTGQAALFSPARRLTAPVILPDRTEAIFG